MDSIISNYPHRAQLFREQCENADNLLEYYHQMGDKLTLPVVDFEYLDMFFSEQQPSNTFYLSEWRGFRSKAFNRLFPKYKFLDNGEWGKTVSIWDSLKDEKYIIVCSPHKRMGPELLGGAKYNRGYYKGHFGIFNLQTHTVECYGEFSILNKYNTPEMLSELSSNLKKALWIDLAMMFDIKLKESIEKASGIPSKNIHLDLETI